jgi:hypothetical protein
MQKIRVLHCNTSAEEGWTADSPDLKGWSVAGGSYGETQRLAEEAVHAQLARGGSDGAVIAPADVEISHHIACVRR